MICVKPNLSCLNNVFPVDYLIFSMDFCSLPLNRDKIKEAKGNKASKASSVPREKVCLILVLSNFLSCAGNLFHLVFS